MRRKRLDTQQLSLGDAVKTPLVYLRFALTTIVGFAAVVYAIYHWRHRTCDGEGIIFSFVTTIILMPILILLFSKLLNKTMKKNYSGRNIDKVAALLS